MQASEALSSQLAKQTQEPSQTQQERDAFEKLLLKADTGDAKAQYRVGRCYKKGTGVNVNKTKAFEYFQKSAHLKNKAGQTSAGIWCLEEASAEKNEAAIEGLLKKAIEYLLLAAGQKESVALNRLGDCYLYGKGVPVDLTKAQAYFELAAAQGDNDARINLDNLKQYLLELDLAKSSAKAGLPPKIVGTPLAAVSTVPATATLAEAIKSATGNPVMFSPAGQNQDNSKNSAERPVVLDIKISIRTMIEELKTYIANNEKMVHETGFLKSLAKSVVTVGGYFPSTNASKAFEGNKKLKVQNAKGIQQRLETLLKVDYSANAAAGLTSIAPLAGAAESNPIPAEFYKILNDYATLDKAAGGGEETQGIIKKYKIQLINFNDEQLNRRKQTAEALAKATSQSAALPPLISSTNK